MRCILDFSSHKNGEKNHLQYIQSQFPLGSGIMLGSIFTIYKKIAGNIGNCLFCSIGILQYIVLLPPKHDEKTLKLDSIIIF